MLCCTSFDHCNGITFKRHSLLLFAFACAMLHPHSAPCHVHFIYALHTCVSSRLIFLPAYCHAAALIDALLV
eukprot:m.371843 g.371843  ORF g.371843 m.371843 type:complete len:72 (+) comp60123_c0_seq1:215-430(+)